MNRRSRFVPALSRSVLSLALAGASTLTACGGSAASEQPQSQASAATGTRAPLATKVEGHLKVFTDAIADVPLRPEQRAEIEKLVADAQQRHDADRAAHAAIADALAAQVERGQIDRGALQPKVDAAAEAWAKSRPADRAALERLHAILDPAQRAALVDAVRAHLKDARHEMRDRHPMEEWATDLKLTDAQRAQIGAALRDQLAEHHGHGEWKEHKERAAKAAEAFKSDRFVMDEVLPPVDAHAKANEMSGRFVGVVEKVLPILTPEQRTIAAQKIRERAAHPEAMPGPVGGP